MSRTGTQPLILLVSLAIFLSYVDRGLIGIAGPLLKGELGLTATGFGLAVSAFFWVYAPAQILCGWLVDRFSVYRQFAGGVALWGVATGLAAAAGGLVSLVGLRALMGLGQSFCFPGSSKIIARHCTPETRGIANGAISAGLAAGQAAGALFGGLIMIVAGWRAMFALFGVLTVVWLLPWRWLAPSAGPEALDEDQDSVRFGEILGRRALWGGCGGHFCNNYGLYFVISWLPLYLTAQRGFSIALMSTVITATFVVQAVTAFVSGWLSDVLVRRLGSEGPVRRTIIVWANVAKAVAIVGAALADSTGLLVFWLLVTGAAIGFTGTQNFAIPQIFAGDRASGRWVGMQNFVANLAGIIAPIVTGVIVDATGSYDNAFWVAGAVTLCAAFFWGIVVPKIEPVRWTGTAVALA